MRTHSSFASSLSRLTRRVSNMPTRNPPRRSKPPPPLTLELDALAPKEPALLEYDADEPPTGRIQSGTIAGASVRFEIDLERLRALAATCGAVERAGLMRLIAAWARCDGTSRKLLEETAVRFAPPEE